jgi:hypothetical protein
MGLVARQLKIALPATLAIDAEVDLNQGDSGYFPSGRLSVSLAWRQSGKWGGRLSTKRTGPVRIGRRREEISMLRSAWCERATVCNVTSRRNLLLV